ncbi:MAG: translation initiation factor IF-3 [Verrucomicrobia bacterium]|nr:translation initiation factor IF-3 [Verrucomicrobiota bacterium]
MSRPFSPRSPSSPNSFVKVNGKIRAREVRIIGLEGHQLGVFPLAEAINMARGHGVDLVEIAPNAAPPVCRLVDYGKFRYEQAKREKEAKKHQHANKVKEIQLSATIDPHDFGVKLHHAIDFLCEEMKVKLSLRFRGREMAHTELGFQIVEKFIKELTPFGHPDAPARLIGRGINLMVSPLPRNKRAKNPREMGETAESAPVNSTPINNTRPQSIAVQPKATPPLRAVPPAGQPPVPQTGGFVHNPFSGLDIKIQTGS